MKHLKRTSFSSIPERNVMISFGFTTKTFFQQCVIFCTKNASPKQQTADGAHYKSVIWHREICEVIIFVYILAFRARASVSCWGEDGEGSNRWLGRCGRQRPAQPHRPSLVTGRAANEHSWSFTAPTKDSKYDMKLGRKCNDHKWWAISVPISCLLTIFRCEASL